MTRNQKKARAKAIRLNQKKVKTFKNFKNSTEDCPIVKIVEIKKNIHPEVTKVTLDFEDEKPQNKYVEAAEMELFDSEGRHIDRWKGIVNKEKTNQMYAIMGRGYKIAQHDDVLKAIRDSITELDLTHNERITEMNEGGRLHAIINFPKIVETLSNGEKLELRVTFDNSYDSTTGLRMILSSQTTKGYFLLTSESYSSYYHKHTKGMDTGNLRKKLEKGINVFRDKIVAQFENMINSELDLPQVLNFLDNCIKEKVISVKYLEMIKDKLNLIKSEEVENQYGLYNLIAEVLTAQVESIDAQKRHMETMYNKIKKL